MPSYPNGEQLRRMIGLTEEKVLTLGRFGCILCMDRARGNPVFRSLFLVDDVSAEFRNGHVLPHLHAKYAEFEASISLDDSEILAGKLPREQLRLVRED